jgi:hypothetical protein
MKNCFVPVQKVEHCSGKDIPEVEILHLIIIYSKNVKDDLSSDEEKILAKLAKMLKEEAKKYG